jgi:hypothetical protein
MIKELSNPMNSFTINAQKILWNHMPDIWSKIYRFEFILPLKAKPKAYMKGGYICYLAETLEDMSDPEIFKGDIVSIEFPIATFERAFLLLTYKQKKGITEADNLEITFIRKSRETMIIKSIERKVPTIEHIQKGEDFYKLQEERKPQSRDGKNGYKQNSKATEEY